MFGTHLIHRYLAITLLGGQSGAVPVTLVKLWDTGFSPSVSLGPTAYRACHRPDPPTFVTHLGPCVQGGLWRVHDKVAQREAESLRVLAEHQSAWALPGHALARPHVLIGRREAISPPLCLKDREVQGLVRLRRIKAHLSIWLQYRKVT